jgi:hypothetical protein
VLAFWVAARFADPIVSLQPYQFARDTLLQAEGNAEAAIRFEQLGNALPKTHKVDILCAYSLSSFHGQENKHAFESICEEHSAVYSQ